MRDIIDIVENYSSNYNREIPRDLFNEANLLKCYGKLYIELEKLNSNNVEMVYENGKPFQISQDSSDGSLSIGNIFLKVKGSKYYPSRPLNSREPWPLYIITPDYTEIEIFTSSGSLSSEFLEWIA